MCWERQDLRTCHNRQAAACLSKHMRCAAHAFPCLCIAGCVSVYACLQDTAGVKYYRKPFEFLSLGIMAYVGNDRALTQVCTYSVVWGVLSMVCALQLLVAVVGWQ